MELPRVNPTWFHFNKLIFNPSGSLCAQRYHNYHHHEFPLAVVNYSQAWKFSMEFLGVSWCFGNHSWFAFVVGPKQNGQKMMMMTMMMMVVVV